MGWRWALDILSQLANSTFNPLKIKIILSQAKIRGELQMSGTSTIHAEQGVTPGHHGSNSNVTPGEIAIGVVIGRASEYFDFFVYAIASVLVFPAVFFPFEDPLTGTLYSFLIFSFAFVARPLGTVALMMVQQKFGRETKLT
ncbi:MAG: MFS transporter, partial [Betaproteobacteria bacterium]